MKIIETPHTFLLLDVWFLSCNKKFWNSMRYAWVGAPQNWLGDMFFKPRKSKFWERFNSYFYRYTNADLKICLFLCFLIKLICRRFHITTPFTFWDMRTQAMWKVCLQTLRNNIKCLKLTYFFKKLRTSRKNNSRILRIKNAKCAGYIVFIWTITYCKNFKSALVYLEVNISHSST